MAEVLVLVRHGKAAPAEEGQPDSLRPLTEAGRRSLEATISTSLQPVRDLIDAGTDAVVWASPALRACQTANIVCRALGIEGYEKHPVLAGTDPAAMYGEVKGDPHALVILVGHTPSVDKISQAACGTRLPFKPGAVCMLDLEGRPATPENLRHFAQGPQVDRWETALALEHAIREAGKATCCSYHDFVDDPSDPDIVHDLRVSIRTLRSLIVFAEPWLKEKRAKKAQDHLRELVRLTSRLREFDVLSDTIAGLEPAAEELTAACKQCRAEEAEHVLDGFASRRSQKTIGDAQKYTQHIVWRDGFGEQGIDPAEVAGRYRKLCEKFAKHYNKLDLTDEEHTHAVRKEAKLLRYVSHSLPGLLGDEAEATEVQMHAVQDRLGELCDARANVEIADSFPAERLSEQSAADLARLRVRQLTCIDQLLADMTDQAARTAEADSAAEADQAVRAAGATQAVHAGDANQTSRASDAADVRTPDQPASANTVA